MKGYLSGIFIFLFLITSVSAQHNSSYSQYMFNGLLLNPAYAGSHEALNLTALYRKQWLGIEGAPTTMNFTAHLPLRKKKAALGMVVANDKFGISDNTLFHIDYAYRIKAGKGTLSLGLLAGIEIHQTNWNQVRTTQIKDPSFTGNAQRFVSPRAGAGIYYYAQKFYLGLSAPSILNTRLSLTNYQLLLFNTGCVLNSSGNFKIKPAVLVKYLLNSPLDANLSTTFYWKDYIGVGVGYSLNNTGFMLVDAKVNDQFRIGYGYDYSFSVLRNYSTGSHEVILRYLFQYKIQVPSIRYF